MKTSGKKSGISAFSNHHVAFGVIALTLAMAPFSSRGQTSIGVNFAGRQWSIGGNTPETVTSSDFAGVVSQQNWNNVDPAGHDSGGLSQITGPNAGVLSDSTGTALAGMTFSYAAQGMWAVSQTTFTGNRQLMNGYSDAENSGNGHYNFGNISYNLYDVYVYISADSNGRTAGVDINGGSQTYLLTDANGYNYANPLIEGTATTQGSAASAQYVLFQDVTGSSLSVDLNYYGQNVGVAGIQIVAVPEPTTIAFSVAGLAMLGLLRRWSCRQGFKRQNS